MQDIKSLNSQLPNIVSFPVPVLQQYVNANNLDTSVDRPDLSMVIVQVPSLRYNLNLDDSCPYKLTTKWDSSVLLSSFSNQKELGLISSNDISITPTTKDSLFTSGYIKSQMAIDLTTLKSPLSHVHAMMCGRNGISSWLAFNEKKHWAVALFNRRGTLMVQSEPDNAFKKVDVSVSAIPQLDVSAQVQINDQWMYKNPLLGIRFKPWFQHQMYGSLAYHPELNKLEGGVSGQVGSLELGIHHALTNVWWPDMGFHQTSIQLKTKLDDNRGTITGKIKLLDAKPDILQVGYELPLHHLGKLGSNVMWHSDSKQFSFGLQAEIGDY